MCCTCCVSIFSGKTRSKTNNNEFFSTLAFGKHGYRKQQLSKVNFILIHIPGPCWIAMWNDQRVTSIRLVVWSMCHVMTPSLAWHLWGWNHQSVAQWLLQEPIYWRCILIKKHYIVCFSLQCNTVICIAYGGIPWFTYLIVKQLQ